MNARCEALTAKSGDEFSPLKPLYTTRSEQPDTLSSADDGLFVSAIERIKTYWHAQKMRKIDRDAFRHLAKLDESILQDIGVSRADVEWAMKLPLSQNASDALQQVSRGYKKRA